MDQILTNEMLMENTVWATPGMYLPSYFIDHNFEVLAAGNIGPLNGLFRAIILGGKPFITMANVDYIPFPPFGYHEVKLWADSWDGDNDPIQWPQPYLSFNSHFPAILCPNSLLNHQIIWWMLSLSDFVSHMSTLSPLSGLGKISESQYTALHTSVTFLLQHSKQYHTSSKHTPPFILPMIKWLQHVLNQLCYVHMSFCHAQFIVHNLQRVWLHLWAVLNYMEIFKPQMDGLAPPS